MRGLVRFAAALALLFLASLPATAHGARAWQAPEQISGPADTKWAAVDVGENGRVAALWTEGANGEEQLRLSVRPGLEAMVLDPQGRRGAVAVAGTGEVAVSWLQERGDGELPHTMLAMWTPLTGLGDPIDLGASGWGRPVAAAANATGDMVVGFVREIDYSARLYSTFRPAGGAFGEPVEISSTGSLTSLDLALSPAGHAAFAWQANTVGSSYAVFGADRAGAAPPSPAAQLSAEGVDAVGPAVAVDGLGRSVAAFVERPADRWDGWLRASVRTAAGWAAATGIDGYTDDGPDVAADADGDAVITWAHFTPYPNGGQGGPLRVASGNLGTGAFAAGTNVYPLQHPFFGPAIAMRPDGSAAIAWEDFSSGEVRTVRRDGTSTFAGPQTVKCPGRAGSPLLAGIDGTGAAWVAFRRSDVSPSVRPLWLARDAQSETPSPESCPAVERKSYPLYDPWMPAPGQEVTIDVEGTRDSDAVSTTWSWDLDYDGTFERETGSNPVTKHSWATEGQHTWSLAAHTVYGQGGGGTAIWNFTINVQRPFAPPPGPPKPPPAAAAPTVAVTVPPRQRMAAVLKRGLRLELVANQAGVAQAELWADAKEARRTKLGRKATRVGATSATVAAGKPALARLKITAKAAKRLRKVRRAKLGLVILRDGKVLAVHPMVIKR